MLNAEVAAIPARQHQFAVPMVYKSDALILRTYKLGEADRIVVFLTRDRGKKRGVAKGARRPLALHGGARAADAGGSGVFRARAARAGAAQLRRAAAVAAVGASGEALGHVGYFAELIDEWAPEAHADERLFRLGASMVDAIAAGAPIEALARYFEYWLLRLQGVYPARRAPAAPARADARGRGDAAAGARVRVPPVRAGRWRDRAVGRGDAVPGAPPGRRRRSSSNRCSLSAAASRELETAHRRLINCIWRRS